MFRTCTFSLLRMSPPTLRHTLLSVWEAGSRRGSSGGTGSLIKFWGWLLLETWQPPNLHWSTCCGCQQLRRGNFWNSSVLPGNVLTRTLLCKVPSPALGRERACCCRPFLRLGQCIPGRKNMVMRVFTELSYLQKYTLKEDSSLL